MRGGPLLAVIGGLTIVLGTVVSSACGGGDGSQRTIAPATATTDHSNRPVSVQSISPSRAGLGARVTIRGNGFTLEHNEIGFAHPDADPQGQHIGYLNDISSPDGRTLTFNLPDNQSRLLGACAFSQPPPDAACPSIGLLLPAGDSVVFVANQYGSSNGVILSVTQAE